MILNLFRTTKRKINHTTGELSEPTQNIMNAVLVGGVTAGVLLGGAYVYGRLKGKKKQ